MRSRRTRWIGRAAGCALLALPAPALAAPGWSSPESFPATEPSGLTIATADDGTTILTWVSANKIQAAVRPPGGPTGDAVTFPCPSGETCATPRVAMNGRGDAILVWQRKDATNYRLDSAYRSAGGTWSGPAPVSPDADAQDMQARIAIAPSGEAIATWRHKSGTVVIVRAARRPAGGGWVTAENISSKTSDWPSIAVDGDGDAIIAWAENGALNDSTRPAGGSWAPDPSPIGGTTVIRPEVAMAPDGRTALGFVQTSDRRVRGSTRAVGGGWSTPEDLGEESSYMDPIDVAMDSAGAATVLFVAGPGGNSISGPWLAPGGLWKLNPSMNLGGFADTYSPRVAGGQGGQTVSAWYGAASPNHIQAATRGTGANWSVTQDLGAGFSPDVALDGQGNAVVAWLDTNRVRLTAHDITAPELASLTVPATSIAGQETGFAAVARDRWSAITAVGWDFGDGTTAAGSAPVHSYAAPGEYTVRATVADALGNVASAVRTISVVAPQIAEPLLPPPGPGLQHLPVVPNTPPKQPTRKVSVLVRSGFQVPPGAPVKASCATRVTLTLRLGSRTLASASAPLTVSGRTCRFRGSFTLARSKVGTAKRLTCVVRYRSTKALAGRTWSLPVNVG
jgi:hypothetical protein